MAETVTIGTLGHRGDGIVAGKDGALFVPFALPGERVSIERSGDRGRIVAILDASADRATPVCRHFGRCGGCALQMMPLEATRQLKRDFVVAALAKRGLRPEVAATIGVSPASRRRAVLAALRVGKRLSLGYHERLSHKIVDIEECPVLVPELAARIESLRELLFPLLPEREPVRVTVLLTMRGIDLAIESAPAPDAALLPLLANLARASNVARLSLAGEPILTLAEPAINVAGVTLVPPPGAFLQASAEAEATMAKLVAEHLDGAKRVADLFAGIGTFALALARKASVHVVETNAAALEALSLATRRAKGLRPTKTEQRDLFAFPLSTPELEEFDGIVFDPPRAGAKAQAAAIAASNVARVVAISCNPATFARDARILVDGGYRIERVVPVDQFVFSAETEVVGLFRRG